MFVLVCRIGNVGVLSKKVMNEQIDLEKRMKTERKDEAFEAVTMRSLCVTVDLESKSIVIPNDFDGAKEIAVSVTGGANVSLVGCDFTAIGWHAVDISGGTNHTGAATGR